MLLYRLPFASAASRTAAGTYETQVTKVCSQSLALVRSSLISGSNLCNQEIQPPHSRLVSSPSLSLRSEPAVPEAVCKGSPGPHLLPVGRRRELV